MILVVVCTFLCQSVFSAGLAKSVNKDSCQIRVVNGVTEYFIEDRGKAKFVENCGCSIREVEGETQFFTVTNKVETIVTECPCTRRIIDGEMEIFAVEDGEKKSTRYCIDLQEPISGTKVLQGDDGASLLGRYIKIIYTYAASIIGILCVLIIVVSGIQISLAGFNEAFRNQARDRIMQAIFSLVILFATALILRTINPGFFTIGS